MSNPKKNKYIAICIMLVGLLPLSNGLGKWIDQKQFQKRSVVIEAEVVAFQTVRDGKHASAPINIYPVVEFFKQDGQRTRARSNLGKYPAANATGDLISVRYDPQNPTDVRENSFTGLWFESVYFMMPGLCILAIGTWLLTRALKRISH